MAPSATRRWSPSPVSPHPSGDDETTGSPVDDNDGLGWSAATFFDDDAQGQLLVAFAEFVTHSKCTIYGGESVPTDCGETSIFKCHELNPETSRTFNCIGHEDLTSFFVKYEVYLSFG